MFFHEGHGSVRQASIRVNPFLREFCSSCAIGDVAVAIASIRSASQSGPQ